MPFHRSIEFIFDDLINRLKDKIVAEKKVASWYSKGIIARIKIIVEASRSQGDINHITGDIHFAAIGLKKNKTILTVHDCGLLSTSSGIKHALLKFFWFTLPIKNVSVITVVSNATKRELLKYIKFDAERIKVIPVAVSPLFNYVSQRAVNKKAILLQVGTQVNKNIERLVNSLIGVQCHLRIIGRLPQALLAKLSSAGISYSNAFDLTLPELVEEYRKADILCFVSTYEGFGMPIIEANAIGLPVITSNILSMPEVAGNAACLVDPFNTPEIRSGILRIINDDKYRGQLIENGLANCKRFNANTIANQYLELYNTLLHESC